MKYPFSYAFLTLRCNSQEDNKIHHSRSCNQVNVIKLLIIFLEELLLEKMKTCSSFVEEMSSIAGDLGPKLKLLG